MGATITESLGWTATAVFAASYLCRRVEVLRAVQMAGAGIWVLYGCLVQVAPVVAANVLVLGMAAWAAWRSRRPLSPPRPASGQ